MYQTDQATAATSIPTPATAGTQGYFTNGNPAAGVPATIVDADWLNMVQQELVNIVTAAGETPSKTTYNQVLLAIKRLVQSQVVLTDTGTANAYAVANTPALTNTTWANNVVQQFIVAHANTGASTFSPDALTAIPIYGLGLQPLQGGELAVGGTAILMKQTITGVNSGNPIAVLLECSGGAQQVTPATKSQHALPLGQATGRLLNIQVWSAHGTYTYTKTPGTTAAYAECQGAGGSGSGTPATGAGQCAVGGPGADGAFCSSWFPAGIASGTTITIGQGGVQVNGGSNNGGSSSIGALMTAPGGRGGSTAGPSAPPLLTGGGAGATGAATGGNLVNSSGSSGAPSLALTTGTNGLAGAAGSASRYGGAGSVVAGNTAGNAATGPGSGGGGSATNASQASIAGGPGADGAVFIYEYGTI